MTRVRWLNFLLVASVALCIFESRANAQEPSPGDCNCTAPTASPSDVKSDPVCGHNGDEEVSFRSQCDACCAFRNDQIERIAYFGPCNGSAKGYQYDSSCRCTKNRDPVCGDDGITYLNDCYRRCSAQEHPCLFVENPGECPHKDLDDDDGFHPIWELFDNPPWDADDVDDYETFGSSAPAGGAPPDDTSDGDDNDVPEPYIGE